MRSLPLVCVVLALAACSEPTAPPSSAPASSALPSSEPGATVPEGPLTQDDDGARVQLTVGQEVSWQLSSDWDWLQPVSDGPAVEVVPVDYLSDPGFQEWLLLGGSEGTAQVTVEGLPACGDPAACPEQQVTLTVDVTG